MAVKGRGVIKCDAHRSLFALRSNERVDQGAQPFERRPVCVLEDAAQQRRRLPPFVALQPEQDRRLIGKILVE